MAREMNFCGVFLAFVVGVYLYAQGFLLNRKELINVNKHVDLSPTYSGVIIIVVDALKFEFVDPNLKKSNGHWAGNLESIRSALDKYPNHSLLFHFEADPPTTTLQRLKGLTTGSFPTFIDASSNFGGSAVTEDNLITQLAHAGKTIAFYGDDTWLSLYPNHFTLASPYPSFDVMDLDTVDNGVRKHLTEQLRQSTWPDVTIAHFLGVDHCGHRFGQNHPEMRRKLHEMDEMIQKVMERLPHDKLLVVLGDHGMTLNGDHGGDSRAEVDAGLFLYSKKGFSPLKYDNKTALHIHQIDLVPTLALLLGIPIPFSNLGQTSAIFFPNRSVANVALQSNLNQIRDYLRGYQSKFNDLPEENVEFFIKKFDFLSQNKKENLDSYADEAGRLLGFIKDTCRKKWTSFNLPSIVSGMIIMCCALIHLSPFGIYFTLRSVLVLIISGLPSLISAHPVPTLSFPVLYLLWLVSTKCRKLDLLKLSMPSFLVAIFISLFVGVCFIVFSNSYIVNEAQSLNFILQTTLFLFLFVSVIDALSESKKDKAQKTRATILSVFRYSSILLPYGVCALSLRCASLFVTCREEQMPHCQAGNITRPISSFDDNSHQYKSWRSCISTITLIAVIYIYQKWLERQGNLKGHRPAVICSRYCLPIVTAGCIANTFIHCLPSRIFDKLPTWVIVLPVRSYFALCLASVVIIYIKPLMISVVKEDLILSVDDYSARPESVVPFIWKRLKETYNESKSSPKKASGLGNVFSATFSLTFFLLFIIFTTLLGDGFLYPLILLYVVVISVSLLIEKTPRWKQDLLFSIMFAQLSHYFFYCLGHQPTLSNIPWHAAFVGFRGEHSYRILPGLFVLLNIFSSYVLISFLLPLTAIVHYTPEWIPKLWKSGTSILHRGEYAFFDAADDSDKNFLVTLHRRYRSYILCAAIMTLSSMIAAAHHRRHLMVWKIFAPRMMFNVVSFGGTLFGSFFGYLLAKRIYFCIRRLEKSLCDEQS